MTRERWEQVSRVFAAALAQPATDRSAFLSRVCGNDEELRHEVETLLAQEVNPRNYLTTRRPSATQVPALQARELLHTGQSFGPYTIERLLGRGEAYRDCRRASYVSQATAACS